jgi:hypothetical protein
LTHHRSLIDLEAEKARLRNLLVIVQAIGPQTLRRSDTATDGARSVERGGSAIT